MLATVLAPILTGAVQLLKKTYPIPKNWIPLIALLLGIALGFFSTPFSMLDTASRLWAGGMAGLSSTGLFELAFNNRSGTSKTNGKGK